MITYGSQIRALYGRIFPAVFGADAIGYVPTLGPAKLGDAFPDLQPGAGTTFEVPAEESLTDDEWAGQPLLRRVFLAGGAWTNLFRRTDPLGWRVFSDHDSPEDLPVPEVPAMRSGDPGPLVQGHGGYPHSLVYRRRIAAWTGEEVVPDRLNTRDVPMLPPM